MKIPILAILVTGFCALVAVAQSEEAQPRKIDQKEYSLGETDAQRDLKQGKIVYEIVGQPSMIDQELTQIALKEYGISVKFHGCMAGPRIDYDQGYLDTVVAHLKKKFSFDPVLKVERDLRTKSREQDGGGNSAALRASP
ncbi:hypothetical protein [Prosthecobacter sp.]|uniref:hypothetical protein n=1 Tax=Prosthecobacter sp. TaxID=1965333 RepID=UPI002488C106|nr:hypothetical protein [Prosthecobacter sp.]MDI1311582.1 hypothetical protein [Prosthecobacter sp.]